MITYLTLQLIKYLGDHPTLETNMPMGAVWVLAVIADCVIIGCIANNLPETLC